MVDKKDQKQDLGPTDFTVLKELKAKLQAYDSVINQHRQKI